MRNLREVGGHWPLGNFKSTRAKHFGGELFPLCDIQFQNPDVGVTGYTPLNIL